MAKSVLELAVGTGQWDAGLKKARTALDNFTQANGGLQSALTKDSASMQKFVQMMGRMDSTAKTAKGQMNDYKGTIEQLTMQYNRLTDAQKKTIGQDYLRSIDQMKQKYQGVAEEVQKINQSLKSMPEPAAMSGGGLFGGDNLSGMLQVFGGNVMTKLAGVGVGFVSELKDMVAQGIELARAGEGVRIAFQRLGRGDILDGLREATHGTVTDLELMKAAVKFNDFKLPLDELGTMLAFAQQKAKDTGQSVDYMVDSIVTGLGRKSLMILDNLGLSAAEIKEKMAETGDMTKAVGAIIREQMAKAGDYVETAADRATQANVAMQNKMEELGQKFLPVKQASDDLWTSMKIGILDIVGGPLANLLNGLTRAGQLRNELKNIGSDERVNTDIDKLKGSNYKPQAYQMMLAKYSREEQKALDNYKKAQRGGMGSIAVWENRYLARKSMREDFQARGSAIVNPTPTTTTPVPVEIKNPTGGGGGNTFDASKIKFVGGEGFKADPNANFVSVWEMMGGDEGLRKMMGIGRQQLDLGRDITEKDYKKLPGYKEDKETKKLTDEISTLTSGLSSIAGGLKSMGIDLPAEVDQVIGVIQGVTSVIEGVNAIISIFSTSAMSANTAALIANTAALNANTVTSFLPFANGGVIPTFAQGGLIGRAAGGMMIPGNSMSGDRLRLPVDGGRGMIGVNSGELILNRAQQGNLASQLQGGVGAMQLSAIITGEQLRLVLNNNGRRTGRGEYVTTNFR